MGNEATSSLHCPHTIAKTEYLESQNGAETHLQIVTRASIEVDFIASI